MWLSSSGPTCSSRQSFNAKSGRAATTCSTNDVPMTTGTFNPASLPDFSYIVPNQCDDMHTLPGNGAACPAYFGANSGTSLINMGDKWLATVIRSCWPSRT
jgi:hypothetical protein